MEEIGFSIHHCQSEDEARNFDHSEAYKSIYPVCFFTTDTSGEKMYEEFYTDSEQVDFNYMSEMGVINKQDIKDIAALRSLIKSLKEAFNNEKTSKKDIIQLMTNFIQDFNHKETGKNLDQKM